MNAMSASLEDGVLTISVEGRLDSDTSPKLEEMLRNSFESADAFVFDFAKLRFLSSAGLRVLVATAKKSAPKNKTVTIRNVSDEIKMIFEMTGLDTFLKIT